MVLAVSGENLEWADHSWMTLRLSLTESTETTLHAVNEGAIQMTVDLRYVKDLAALDSIRSIGLDHPATFESTVARGIMGVDVGCQVRDANNVLVQQFRGRGQLVTVADKGFDKGDIHDVHPAFGDRVRVMLQRSANSTPTNLIFENGTPEQSKDVNGHGEI